MKTVDIESYKPRLVDQIIDDYLDTAKAVCVEGPKWCGKTWASSYHSKSEYLVGNPDRNFQNRKLAEMEPTAVLIGEQPRLIDEWQEVPALWDAVRMTADKSSKRGQFILTGSSTPVTKGIMHSGTGRIVRIRMHTMSLYESGDSSGRVSLKSICYGDFSGLVLTGDEKLHNIARLICRGGWPDNLNTKEKNISIMPRSYLEAVVNDDIQRLDKNVRYEIPRLHLLLRSLARNESTTASSLSISKDISSNENKSLSDETVTRYINAFSRLFLIENQKPFAPNVRSSIRIKQQEKHHFCDPALACAALNLTPVKLENDLETFGFMFEAMAERDLRIYAETFGAELYHYQDYNNNEIDAVIELDNGEWCAFEIKLGANQIDKAAANLIKIKQQIEKSGGKGPKTMCVICGLSNAAYLRDDGVYVVPLTALKN